MSDIGPRTYSQFTQAVWMLRRLTAFDSVKVDTIFAELEQLLDRAQNAPPQGDADGSIDEPVWVALRELVESAKRYRAALRDVLDITWRKLRETRPPGA